MSKSINGLRDDLIVAESHGVTATNGKDIGVYFKMPGGGVLRLRMRLEDAVWQARMILAQAERGGARFTPDELAQMGINSQSPGMPPEHRQQEVA
ncbi:MAG: hypothetical protein ACNA75_06275 [Thiohalomonadaceae bacterium]